MAGAFSLSNHAPYGKLSRMSWLRSRPAPPVSHEPASAPSRPTSWAFLLALLVLTGLVVAVFRPILDFEFIDLDVRRQVIENPAIRGLSAENLKQIFTTRGTTSSYYPVRSLTYAIDYQIWGLKPRGFKLTNGLIHLANVLLAFGLAIRLLRRQTSDDAATRSHWPIASATVAAAVLAVHPVVVESVTWVGGREELLMALGTLGCVHLHLSARWLYQRGGALPWIVAYHVAATLCCVAACLSNAVAAVIPLLVTACDVLVVRGLTFRKVFAGTAALWAMALITVAVKKIGEYIDMPGMAAPLSFERLTLILEVYWLNLKAIIWPTELAVSHTWFAPTSPVDPEVVLGGIAATLTGLILWKVRRREVALFGLVWFGLALGPAAQIMPHHLDRADRFLYLPLVGLVLAAACGIDRLGNGSKRQRGTVLGIAALGLTLLGLLSAVQIQWWRNDFTVWESCLRLEPDNPQILCGYGDSLARRGQYRRAIVQYETAIERDPESDEAPERLARLLTTCPDLELVDHERAVQLAQEAFRVNPSCLRTLALALGNLAQAQAADGRYPSAINNYRTSLQFWSHDEAVVLRLALLLATCPRQQSRDSLEAVRLAEQACQWQDHRDALGLSVLATAYAAADRYELAAATAELGLPLAGSNGDTQLAAQLQHQCELYRNGATGRNLDSGGQK